MVTINLLVVVNIISPATPRPDIIENKFVDTEVVDVISKLTNVLPLDANKVLLSTTPNPAPI